MSATIPEVGPLPPVRLPSVVDEVLPNGLRIVAARRPGIPRFEARLHVPTARGGTPADPARRRVLAKAILSGTTERTAEQLAEDLQTMGGGLEAGCDTEELVLGGSALSRELGPFLDLMAEVLTAATYPRDEVSLERERIAQDLRVARTQPASIAQEAFLGRLYGRHPYGLPRPSPEAVGRVGAAAVRTLHAERVLPAGSVLVVVGDVRPAAVVAAAGRAFAPWKGRKGRVGLPAIVPEVEQPTLLVDRPGSVQTSIRIGGLALARSDPDHPALTLANLVFGGYFAARLSSNIRERRGYTYGAVSRVMGRRAGPHLMIQTDVGTEVTVPALVETRYELSRMVAAPPEAEELVAAKRYLAGTLAMGVGTQMGLASSLSVVALEGLSLDYLRDFPKRVERLTATQVHDAALRFFSPRTMATVLVGDADRIGAAVAALDELEVRPAS